MELNGLLVFILLTIALTTGLVGVNKGAPYKNICLIRKSNSFVAAINVILDLMIVRLSPKNARIAFNKIVLSRSQFPRLMQ